MLTPIYKRFFLAVFVVALISCGQGGRNSLTPETDKAVIAVVLRDFSNWKEATFGELEGVLELEPNSEPSPDATPEGVRSLASNIAHHLNDEVVAAFIERNKFAAPVTPLFSGSPWARLHQQTSDPFYRMKPPDGVKAIGSLALPGFSSNGSRALIQIHHSWSVHIAVVTYVLSNKSGNWRIVARDQTVYI